MQRILQLSYSIETILCWKIITQQHLPSCIRQSSKVFGWFNNERRTDEFSFHI